MMDEQIRIEERGSTHVYRQIKMLSEEELVLRENRCVYEQPAYCVAACPLKLDTKAFMDAAAKGQIDKALQIIRDDAGTHFDPEVVKAFLNAEDKVREIAEEHGDAEGTASDIREEPSEPPKPE